MGDKQKARLGLLIFFALLLAGYFYLAAQGFIDWVWWKEILLMSLAVFAIRVLLGRRNNT